MALADGNIRIDTRLNTKGFNSGLAKMMAGFAKFGAVIGTAMAALGVSAGLTSIIKQGVQASSEFEAAMIGVQSVVEGNGRSFANAKKFLDEYTKDGLVPMTNAATAYKNLTARGYNTEQISQTMTALKDSAAFGRQSALTMGQAIQSATEGLKNENSVLVDNAGVTKNVSVMWTDYARSIGKTVLELSSAEKIVAETNGILTESRFQVGDAAKLSETYAGKVARLGTAFYYLKKAIGDSVTPILNILVPAITKAINWLTALFQRVATFMSSIFGTPVQDALGGTTEATDAATAAQEGLADAVGKTEKAAKGSLAAFDEINVLNQESESGAGAGGGASIPPQVEVPPPGDDGPTKWEKFLDKIKKFFEPIVTAWNKVWNALKRIFKAIGTALEPLIGEGKGFSKFFTLLRDGVATILEGLAIALNWLAQELEENPEIIQVLTIAVLAFATAMLILNAPIVAVVAAVLALIAAVGWLANNWDMVKEKAKETWDSITGWVKQAVEDVIRWIKGIGPWAAKTWQDMKDKAKEKWDETQAEVKEKLDNIKAKMAEMKDKAKEAWQDIQDKAANVVNKIKETWQTVKTWFQENVINPVKTAFETAWNSITGWVTGAWTTIETAWNTAITWFQDNVITPIQTAFETAWTTIETAATTAFETVKNVVKDKLNGVIGFLNGLLSAITGGINNLIGLINGISFKTPKWVVDWFGAPESIGFSIPTVTAPQIPLLASGAVIPPNAAFAAILGDQRSGRNLEAPESLIRQIVREETQQSPSQEVTINFAGNMGTLVRALKPYIDKENKRTGKSLVAGRGTA